ELGPDGHPDLGLLDPLAVDLAGAVLQAALHRDEMPLADDLREVLRRVAPDHDAVPLGPLLAVVVPVAEEGVGGEGGVGDRGAVALGEAEGGVLADSADESYEVVHDGLLAPAHPKCRSIAAPGVELGRRCFLATIRPALLP